MESHYIIPDDATTALVKHQDRTFAAMPRYRARLSSLKDLFEIALRQRRVLSLAFSAVLLGTILAACLLPSRYTAHLKVLVRHERMDQVITPSADAVRSFSPQGVSDEEIDSEIELIHSQDLLERVVLDYGLDKAAPRFGADLMEKWFPVTPAERVSKAVQRFKSNLDIERVKKSSFIDVSFTSNEAKLSASALNALGAAYLTKHMVVRRPLGEFSFFQQQAELYRQRLADAEARLAAFNGTQGAVGAAEAGRNMVLQKATDLEYTLHQTRATLAATQGRIASLHAQLSAIPPRMNTQMKKADNSVLLEQLKSTLLNLELQRTDLLSKYDPTYVSVKQVETQIAQTHAAIDRETQAPVQEVTTDQNPTYQWLSGELAKAEAEIPTLEANANATGQAVRGYRGEVGRLDQKGLQQQDLLRAVKAEEENYLLYLKKQEEARISDQLDTSRISNVVIADAATPPAFPATSRLLLALLGLPLGLVVGLGAAVLSDFLDPYFRTADEVFDVLSLQVLAEFPSAGRVPVRGSSLA